MVTAKFLGLFANLFTVDDKYSFHKSKTLPQLIQMQLYKK